MLCVHTSKGSDTNPAITGIGLVTPLGATAEETWTALLAGQFITDHSRAILSMENPLPVLRGRAGWGSAEIGDDRLTQLALHAARQAIISAGWSERDLSHDRTALIVGTSKGPVEKWLTKTAFLPPPVLRGKVGEGASPNNSPIALTGLSSISADLAQFLRLGFGPRLTISTACASGLEALIRGVLMLRAGEADRVLVVAAESSLHPLFIASFKRLGVLPRPGVGCRPFDETREGFLMSEAAAAVCLETLPFPQESSSPGTPGEDRGGGSLEQRACLAPAPTLPRSTGGGSKRAYCQIDRIALGGDATHLTGGDPYARTLKRLIKHVIDDRPVDLIHAHATGTVTNDPIELAAIEYAIGIGRGGVSPPFLSAAEAAPTRPMLYSHKDALGHSLGAAGLVSVVLNTLCHQSNSVPSIANLRNPMKTECVQLCAQAQQKPIRRSIVLANGFGGPVAAISLINSSVNELE